MRLWVRVLAWAFVAAAALALVGGTFMVVSRGGVEPGAVPGIVIAVVLELYVTSVLLYVGMNGKAPHSWLPWS